MSPISVSFVLLALNEEESIADAIADCRRYAEASLSDYEIIVVDDGSRDGTRAKVEELMAAADDSSLRLIVHAQNKGMGASMRDGYLAAKMEYIAHLPGDRQVRSDAVARLVPLAGEQRIVCSVFASPPSGLRRLFMSRVFRHLLTKVGNMKVNFAGTYLFHRQQLKEVDLTKANSDSFLFSFQLLELFRRRGLAFQEVTVPCYPREHGSSREATATRIANMAKEIAQSRL